MEKIFITQKVIEYVKKHKSAFNGLIPTLNEEWVVKRVITYPSVNHGEPMIEIEKDNNWMRLSADIFYSKEYAEYLEKKYKEKNESN